MPLHDLSFSWGELEEIKPKDIGRDTARHFINELRENQMLPVFDVYACSDRRNKGLRQILKHIPGVSVYSTAGNVVEKPNFRPSVVIAHGDSSMTCKCGAVDYAVAVSKGDMEPIFEGLADEIKPDPLENAIFQLEKVPKDWRAGVLFYDHTTAKIIMPESIKDYNNSCDKRHILNYLYEELSTCLDGRFTDYEINDMATGQNPEIILLNNFSMRTTAYDLFRVDIQGSDISEVVNDSMGYAMSHALKGNGSFSSSADTVVALDVNSIPNNLSNFLEQSFVKEYVSRGGSVYLVEVGANASAKKIHHIVSK